MLPYADTLAVCNTVKDEYSEKTRFLINFPSSDSHQHYYPVHLSV